MTEGKGMTEEEKKLTEEMARKIMDVLCAIANETPFPEYQLSVRIAEKTGLPFSHYYMEFCERDLYLDLNVPVSTEIYLERVVDRAIVDYTYVFDISYITLKARSSYNNTLFIIKLRPLLVTFKEKRK